MKATQTLVTSSNSPLTIPLNPRGGATAIGAKSRADRFYNKAGANKVLSKIKEMNIYYV